MAEVLLSIKEVEVRRGMGIVLSAYDLDVLAGDILVISGENGSGKSTVIETAARLLPLEKGHVSHHGHLTHHADGRNPICGDEISVYLQVEGEAFSAFTFSGQGCAISKASASLMTEDLGKRPLEQAKERASDILVLLGKDFEGDPFERYGDLGALTAVRRYPARLKCATLAWHAFLAALAGETTASTEDS